MNKEPTEAQCARCGEKLYGYIIKYEGVSYCSKCYKEKQSEVRNATK